MMDIEILEFCLIHSVKRKQCGHELCHVSGNQVSFVRSSDLLANDQSCKTLQPFISLNDGGNSSVFQAESFLFALYPRYGISKEALKGALRKLRNQPDDVPMLYSHMQELKAAKVIDYLKAYRDSFFQSTQCNHLELRRKL